jgi:hypothetical protein
MVTGPVNLVYPVIMPSAPAIRKQQPIVGSLYTVGVNCFFFALTVLCSELSEVFLQQLNTIIAKN